MNRIALVWLVSIITLLITGCNSTPENSLSIEVGGKGEYDCNGIQDQKKINMALAKYSTVYLKGSGECIIDEPITLKSGNRLLGVPSVEIKLKDGLNWEKYKPIIGQSGVKEWNPFGDENNTISNIELSGFKLNAGVQKKSAGTAYYPLILFCNPKNVKIHDLILSNSKWDTIRLISSPKRNSLNSEIYNNKILNSGHEGICIINGKNFKIYNNIIQKTRTNCGIRIKNGDKFSIDGNEIGNSLGKKPSGYAGILIENKNRGISEANISNNLIYGKNGGIVLNGNESNLNDKMEGVHIYKNILYRIKHISIKGKNLDGGIRINGFDRTLIERNIIESSSRDGIIYKAKKQSKKNYKTFVKDNIIIYNKRYAINNSKKFGQRHNFILERNVLYGNKDNYYNTSSKSDIYKKPHFIKPHTIENIWHHIAVTYNSSAETLTLYIDGEQRLQEKSEGFGELNPNRRELFIASYRGVAHWFNGKIALKIYNDSLNSKDIKMLHQRGREKDIDEKNIELKLKTTFFDKNYRYIKYPPNISFAPNFTISAWIYSMDRDEHKYHTILSKGKEGERDYIWIYIKRDTIFVKLVNGGKHIEMDTSILNLREIFKLKEENEET